MSLDQYLWHRHHDNWHYSHNDRNFSKDAPTRAWRIFVQSSDGWVPLERDDNSKVFLVTYVGSARWRARSNTFRPETDMFVRYVFDFDLDFGCEQREKKVACILCWLLDFKTFVKYPPRCLQKVDDIYLITKH